MTSAPLLSVSGIVKEVPGVHTLDAGMISWCGNTVSLSTPAEAMRCGIATIHQELDLVDGLSVAEKIFLGHEQERAGAVLIQWSSNSDATAQQWRAVDQGGGVVSLVNRLSGLAMDVWSVSTADGARISQYTVSGNANQRFQLQRV